jgi:hypothetical protein
MRVIDLDAALQAGMTVTLAELDAEEFQGLQLLRSEREKYSEEKNRRG